MIYLFVEWPHHVSKRIFVTSEDDPQVPEDDPNRSSDVVKYVDSSWDEIQEWMQGRGEIEIEEQRTGDGKLWRSMYVEILGDEALFEFKVRWL